MHLHRAGCRNKALSARWVRDIGGARKRLLPRNESPCFLPEHCPTTTFLLTASIMILTPIIILFFQLQTRANSQLLCGILSQATVLPDRLPSLLFTIFTSFIEAYVTYNKQHVFKVCNLINFDIWIYPGNTADYARLSPQMFSLASCRCPSFTSAPICSIC